MSYDAFFLFGAGLRRTQIVPRGTLHALQDHVAWVERELQIEVEAGVYLGRTPGEWPARLGARVRRFDDRAAAAREVKRYRKRTLVVVPVRRR